LFKGAIAFDTGSGTHTRVVKGTLTNGATNTLWRGNDEWGPGETVIGAGGGVAWINYADGAEAALEDAMVASANGRVIDGWPHGDHHKPVTLDLSGDGRRLTIRGRATVHYTL